MVRSRGRGNSEDKAGVVFICDLEVAKNASCRMLPMSWSGISLRGLSLSFSQLALERTRAETERGQPDSHDFIVISSSERCQASPYRPPSFLRRPSR